MRTTGIVRSVVQDRQEKDEPVSLAPLDPETALRALLAVKAAEDEDAETAGEPKEA
jgi:hypothetical protein